MTLMNCCLYFYTIVEVSVLDSNRCSPFGSRGYKNLPYFMLSTRLVSMYKKCHIFLYSACQKSNKSFHNVMLLTFFLFGGENY